MKVFFIFFLTFVLLGTFSRLTVQASSKDRLTVDVCNGEKWIALSSEVVRITYHHEDKRNMLIEANPGFRALNRITAAGVYEYVFQIYKDDVVCIPVLLTIEDFSKYNNSYAPTFVLLQDTQALYERNAVLAFCALIVVILIALSFHKRLLS